MTVSSRGEGGRRGSAGKKPGVRPGEPASFRGQWGVSKGVTWGVTRVGFSFCIHPLGLRSGWKKQKEMVEVRDSTET